MAIGEKTRRDFANGDVAKTKNISSDHFGDTSSGSRVDPSGGAPWRLSLVNQHLRKKISKQSIHTY